MTQSLPHVVIVHGAWHNPAHYVLLATSLEKRGFSVSCPLHPTCIAGNVSSTFTDDSASLQEHIKDKLKSSDIVVIAHSYGGMVTAEGLRGLDNGHRKKSVSGPGKIIGLLFVTCFIPGENERLIDIFGGKHPPWISNKVDQKVGQLISGTLITENSF
jgi:pimeloyl-ACP methyl ester carboxylesterase